MKHFISYFLLFIVLFAINLNALPIQFLKNTSLKYLKKKHKYESFEIKNHCLLYPCYEAEVLKTLIIQVGCNAFLEALIIPLYLVPKAQFLVIHTYQYTFTYTMDIIFYFKYLKNN
jgi:hypothetical protein